MTRDGLQGRSIVVTGSAQGIGRATCVAAAAAGMRVVGIDINEAGAAETARIARSNDGECHFFRCDVSDPAVIFRTFDEIERVVGSIDVLVNNAAIVIHTPPEDITVDQWNRVIGVNLTGHMFAAQAAGRSMIAADRPGTIINMSSIGGLAALGRGNFSYSVTKAAIIGMTRELAVEWASFGIRVNAIAPAQVYTEGFRKLIGDENIEGGDILRDVLPGIPLGRLAEVEDIVDAILFLASERASFITGTTLPVDGGSLALHAGGSVRPRRVPNGVAP